MSLFEFDFGFSRIRDNFVEEVTPEKIIKQIKDLCLSIKNDITTYDLLFYRHIDDRLMDIDRLLVDLRYTGHNTEPKINIAFEELMKQYNSAVSRSLYSLDTVNFGANLVSKPLRLRLTDIINLIQDLK